VAFVIPTLNWRLEKDMRNKRGIAVRFLAAALLALMAYALPAAAAPSNCTACFMECEQEMNACIAGCPLPGQGGRPNCMRSCRNGYLACGDMCMMYCQP
jgi:hypothetical protein